MKHACALSAIALILVGCTTKDSLPPWDQTTQFDQATAQLTGFRILDKRLLAWAREIREIRNSKETIRFDYALLWLEIEGSSEGRYMIIEAIRSPSTTNDKWEPETVIGDNFTNGTAHYYRGYTFYRERPSTKDIRPAWLVEVGLDRHVMISNWRDVTGEEPPRL